MEKNIRIKKTEILSDDYNTLKKITLEYQKVNGDKETQVREVYDKDSGAAVLLYNQEQNTVVLTKQFRIPIYINEGNKGGMAIEVCAGLLEGMLPIECAKKEALEETGYKIDEIEPVFDAYMVPGTVTERVYMFIAKYDASLKIAQGGGLEGEQEEIEILEFDFRQAYQMIFSGEITDAKTIMLLQYIKIQEILS